MNDDQSDVTREEAVALVTQIARQRRKDEEPKFLKEHPEFIIDVLSSEVTYGFHPRALPYSLADFGVLRRILEREYRLQFQIPNELPELMRRFARRMPTDANAHSSGQPQIALDVDEVGQYLFRTEMPMARFKKGRLQVTKRSLVEIEEVVFQPQEVFVKLSGTTDVGELLIKDLVQYLWASAEADRSWEEIGKHLQKKTFGTSTRVRLGFSPSEFLSQRLVAFVDDDVLKGQRFGKLMGSRSDRDSFDAPSASSESWFLDELHISVSRYDSTSRTHENHRIRVGVGRRDYQGTDTMDVNSVLSFEEHCKFVGSLIKRMRTEQKKPQG